MFFLLHRTPEQSTLGSELVFLCEPRVLIHVLDKFIQAHKNETPRDIGLHGDQYMNEVALHMRDAPGLNRV